MLKVNKLSKIGGLGDQNHPYCYAKSVIKACVSNIDIGFDLLLELIFLNHFLIFSEKKQRICREMCIFVAKYNPKTASMTNEEVERCITCKKVINK